MIKKFWVLLTICAIAFSSCQREDRDLVQIEDEAIQAFLMNNGLTSKFTKDSLGYYYQVLEEGEGDTLKKHDAAFFFLGMKTLTGESIKATSGMLVNSDVNTFMPNLNMVELGKVYYITPKGLKEVLLKSKYGEKLRVIMPSYLMFGKDGYNTTVTGNTILDLTIDVIKGKDQTEAEDAILQSHLDKQTEEYIKDSEGFYYHMVEQGTGNKVEYGSSVKVTYTGSFLNGQVFDSASKDSPFDVVVTNGYVIKGWVLALQKMNVGGKMKVVFPSYLAYGANGSGAIPPNTPIQFEIEVL